MSNICKMDCHSCTLQEGNANKALCSTLLLPSMIGRLSAQLQRIESLLMGKDEKEIAEVVLDEVKQTKNKKKNESIKE